MASQGPGGIDGWAYVNDGQARPGTIVRLEITSASDYDVVGRKEVGVGEVAAQAHARGPPEQRRRLLGLRSGFGKRAEPRNKPPFPVTNGVFNKPTALNNVETFANVPQILVKGVDWYKAQGEGEAAGLKFVGVSGDVRKPGIFLVPMPPLPLVTPLKTNYVSCLTRKFLSFLMVSTQDSFARARTNSYTR